MVWPPSPFPKQQQRKVGERASCPSSANWVATDVCPNHRAPVPVHSEGDRVPRDTSTYEIPGIRSVSLPAGSQGLGCPRGEQWAWGPGCQAARLRAPGELRPRLAGGTSRPAVIAAPKEVRFFLN